MAVGVAMEGVAKLAVVKVKEEAGKAVVDRAATAGKIMVDKAAVGREVAVGKVVAMVTENMAVGKMAVDRVEVGKVVAMVVENMAVGKRVAVGTMMGGMAGMEIIGTMDIVGTLDGKTYFGIQMSFFGGRAANALNLAIETNGTIKFVI